MSDKPFYDPNANDGFLMCVNPTCDDLNACSAAGKCLARDRPPAEEVKIPPPVVAPTVDLGTPGTAGDENNG
jgi:hypothetical protein